MSGPYHEAALGETLIVGPRSGSGAVLGHLFLRGGNRAFQHLDVVALRLNDDFLMARVTAGSTLAAVESGRRR
jgi:hypothetical protein